MTPMTTPEVAALIDDEADADDIARLLAELDEPRRAAIVLQSLVGEALRNQAVERPVLGVADAVRAALATEPTVLAPRVTPRRWSREAAGLAIAATVAAVAILGVQWRGADLGTETQVAALAESGAPDSASLAAGLPGEALPGPVAVGAAAGEADAASAAHAEWIRRYLESHSEFRSDTGVGGPSPWARVVSYGDPSAPGTSSDRP